MSDSLAELSYGGKLTTPKYTPRVTLYFNLVHACENVYMFNRGDCQLDLSNKSCIVRTFKNLVDSMFLFRLLGMRLFCD